MLAGGHFYKPGIVKINPKRTTSPELEIHTARKIRTPARLRVGDFRYLDSCYPLHASSDERGAALGAQTLIARISAPRREESKVKNANSIPFILALGIWLAPFRRRSKKAG